MAAVLLQVIHSFSTTHSKTNLFIPANTYEKYNISREYCTAHHDDKICFLPSYSYHDILIGTIKELLKKLDAICFNYQHADCVYTIFNCLFSFEIVVKREELFKSVQGAVHFNHQRRGVDKMTSSAKKRLSRKKYQKQLLRPFHKTELTQTIR